ncbi:hypothetical protein E7T09_08810 [Deinococcus sp. KSM4-11]|uniref:hypothetical protein n=1 Tax=Deinococcus sp. KSM4-11 TaxID=2568654 RepID=UPI0010A52ABC|nr:hypothetical protein [Deinococcus sp. KSM4-11]THF87236.1 hypothetical protein E7T09_08810 [Deinococcus sp. KSM4-11]
MAPTPSSQNGPEPQDVPSGRSPTLEPLEALVGQWFVAMTHVALPETVYGYKTYGWLEGRHFLIERAHFGHPDVPDSLAIIGADASGVGLSARYFDSRGVERELKMTLGGGKWTMWRDAPGFFQRFTGTFGEDGTTIDVVGELSKDGVTWAPDFTHTYSRGKAE